MGRAVPAIVSFIAGALKLNGVPTQIRETIGKLRKPADTAIDRLVTFPVEKAKKLLAKLLGKLNGKRKLPQAKFAVGASPHTFKAERAGKRIALAIASQDGNADEKADAALAEAKAVAGKKSRAWAQAFAEAVDACVAEAHEKAGGIDLASKTTNLRSPIEKLRVAIRACAKRWHAKAEGIDRDATIAAPEGAELIRATEPRLPAEGETGLYKEVKKLSQAEHKPSGLSYSAYYEADHLPEKALLQHVADRADRISGPAANKGAGATGKAGDADTAAQTAVRAHTGAADGDAAGSAPPKAPEGFGTLGARGQARPHRRAFARDPALSPDPSGQAQEPSKERIAEVTRIAASRAAPGDKESLVKARIAEQLGAEVAKVTALYEADPQSGGRVRARALNGLAELVTHTRADCKPGAAGRTDAAAVGAGPAAAERNALAFGGEHDSVDREGAYGSYAEPGPTGPYCERDHIVDKSYPLGLKKLTFADGLLWSKVAPGGAFAIDRATAAGAARWKRRKILRRQTRFAGTAHVHAYTQGSGAAMSLCRPVHRRVTAATRSADAKADLLSLQGPDVETARSYVLDGHPGIAAAKADIRAAVAGRFMRQTTDHAQAVRDDDAAEKARVAAANPANEQAALTPMNRIERRVKTNLRLMRAESARLVG